MGAEGHTRRISQNLTDNSRGTQATRSPSGTVLFFRPIRHRRKSLPRRTGGYISYGIPDTEPFHRMFEKEGLYRKSMQFPLLQKHATLTTHSMNFPHQPTDHINPGQIARHGMPVPCLL